MKQLYAQFAALHAQYGDVLDIGLVVFIAAVLALLVRITLTRLRRRAEKTQSVFDDAVFYSLSGPASTAVWIIGLSIAVHVAHPASQSVLAQIAPPARFLALLAVSAWFLLRLITAVRDNIMRRAARNGEAVDPTTSEAIAKLLRAVVVITAILVALQSQGVSISGVLAFGGVGGIAIGFAARDILANVFGGFTVYTNRMFSVGDWIRSPDRDIEGIVESIGWRMTMLRRFDKRPLYVPNAVFTTVSVENPSRMTHRRISETISLRFDDAARLAPIVADIRAMLDASEDIDSNELILVYFTNFGAHSLDFMLYCYTVTRQWAEYQQVKQAVLLRCHEIIADHGAEVALPGRRLRLDEAIEVATAQRRDDLPPRQPEEQHRG